MIKTNNKFFKGEGRTKRILPLMLLACMIFGLASQLVFADEASQEKSNGELFSVNASDSYAGEEGETGATIITKNAVSDGITALEIINNHTETEFDRISVDVSAYEFPKGVLLDANFASVEYKYVPPAGTVINKGKMTMVIVVGREKDVVSYAIKSKEAMVANTWTTAVFDLEKFKTHRSGVIEQVYIYPFGYYDSKDMEGIVETVYLGNIGLHKTEPNVEAPVEQDDAGKRVVGQKPKSGFGKVTNDLFEGLRVTLMLFALTLLFALPLGLVISLGSICKVKIIKFPIKLFVWVIRGTPLMLQLMLFYYGPGLLGMTALNRFVAALLAFVINYACYFSEIFRGGIESIPKGQYEAGRVLGLTKTQVFFKIVLMQVVKNILPPMSNEFLTLVKDTALANTITVVEITWIAKRFTSEGLLWPLFYSGVFYLAVCGILTLIFNFIEKKLDYYKV